tara:strand:+ start:175 stop:501 length:327 start_codon:yes stop_codon:yes gene_type:complete
MAFRGQNFVSVWCNFNGNGTIAIRDSFNCSSLTDHGVGNYQVNFSTACANHAVACEGEESGDTNEGSAFAHLRNHSTNSNNTRVRTCTADAGFFQDFEHVYVIVCHDG